MQPGALATDDEEVSIRWPQDRRVLVATTALVVVALAVGWQVRPSGPDPASAVTALEPQGQPPSYVVLVPGYGGSADSVKVLATALVAAGHPVMTLPLPGDGTGDIAAMAPALNEAVSHAGAGVPVDVVGFSMGGLVVRTWARDLGGASRARRIVTVGTPNAGTETAELGATIGACPTACQEMVPGSALLDRLNSGDPTPDGPAWITVRSSSDEVVRPDSTTELDGASNVLLQSVCPDVSVAHSDLVKAALPVAIVVRAVSQQPWVPPTADECTALRSG
ncbi:MAG: alpha/beta fold hydrolase [Actinomycetes bacterium]